MKIPCKVPKKFVFLCFYLLGSCTNAFYAVPSVLLHPRVAHHDHLTVRSSRSELAAAASSNPAATKPVKIKVSARRPSFQSGLRYRSNDWLINFLSLPNSFVIRRIRFHLASNVALSIVAAVLHAFVTKRVAVPLTGHSLMGGFLSLLLVFRTNTAYARFYEARGVWTTTKATCRNLALSVATYMQPHSPKSAAKLQAQLAVFPKALTHTCMAGSIKLADSVKEQLPHPRATSMTPALLLCSTMHKTMYQAMKESSTLQDDRLEALHLNHMSHLIDKLVGSVGSCEKIVKTPVPWSYSRHTSRFLTAWAGTLPFALVGSLGWFSIPVVTAACWCLFGIEEIGHLIEQPFGCISRSEAQAYDVSLPVDQFATQIEAEVRDIASMMSVEKDAKHVASTSMEAKVEKIAGLSTD